MTRKECLDAAANCVLHDRNVEYGGPEQSFRYIADLWSAYLRTKIEPYDAAAMMALFKLARLRWNPYYEDSWADLAGYAACGAELAGKAKAREDAVREAGSEYRKLREQAEGCEELVCDEESDVERVFGTLKKRPAPEFDAPQTKEELIERIKSASPAIYGAHVE